MKRFNLLCLWLLLGCCMLIGKVDYAYATESNQRFMEGVFVEDISLVGMTHDEALTVIGNYIKEISKYSILIEDDIENQLIIEIEDLGIEWINSEVLDEAIEYGQTGNVIRRYKEKTDLEKMGTRVYPLEIIYDESSIQEFVEAEAELFMVEKKDASLTRVSGEFIYEDGFSGYTLDVAGTTQMVYETLLDDYRGGDIIIEAIRFEEDFLGSANELSQIKDVLGTFTTSYTSSSSGRVKNIQVATNFIDGVILYPGEEYSVLQAMLPFTASNGYELGGSYFEGTVISSYGGGVCQVSTTLYNALLLAELDITERYNHSMTVSYVPRAQDAAVSEGGLDLKFVNTLEYPIYIEGYNTSDKRCTFTIYGVETRPENRKIVIESEITEVLDSNISTITAVSESIGYVEVNSGYTGYRSKLWKLIYEDGVLVDRVQMNSSVYRSTAGSASVGVASTNSGAVAAVKAAIATGDIDQVKSVSSYWAEVLARPEVEPEDETVPDDQVVEPLIPDDPFIEPSIPEVPLIDSSIPEVPPIE